MHSTSRSASHREAAPHRHRHLLRRPKGAILTAAAAVGAIALGLVATGSPVVADLTTAAGHAKTGHTPQAGVTKSAGSKHTPPFSGAGGTPIIIPPAGGTGGGAGGGSGGTGGGTSGGGSTGGGTVTGIKAPMLGLLDRHHAPPAAFKGVIKGFVVDVSWASLQPVQGGPIVHPNAIDTAIKTAQAEGLTLKLRIRAGIDAPAWAKTLDGPPVTFHYTDSTVQHAGEVAGTVGRFWTARFGAAYDDLQTKLAALYDNVPQVRQTDATRCQTIYSETYLRNTLNAANAKGLLAAGFTVAADDVCHDQQIQAGLVWKHTRTDVAFNAYQSIQSNGTTKADLPYTLSQMQYCRQVLGERCVLENHSLSASRIDQKSYAAIYGLMQQLDNGGNFDFQTATAGRIGNYDTVLSWAASHHATSVELPTGYTSWAIGPLGTMSGKFVNPM